MADETTLASVCVPTGCPRRSLRDPPVSGEEFVGVNYVAFTVDDVEAEYEEI